MDADQPSLARRFVDRYGGRIRDFFNERMRRYSRVGDPAVFEPACLPWTADLEAHWQTIRDEAVAAVLDRRDSAPPIALVSPDHERLGRDGKWKTFFLHGYGYRVEDNCRRCPVTARLVAGVPGLITAMYSIHEAGAHLPRHRGVTKSFLTAHLGLVVPAQRERCRIAVEDRVYHWQEGRFFVFDDTFQHEVWNDTNEDRVILLMHVKRPMRGPGRWLQSLFLTMLRISPFVQEARRNILRWHREHAHGRADHPGRAGH